MLQCCQVINHQSLSIQRKISKTSTLLINTYHWNLVTVRDKKNTSTDLISKYSYAASR